MPELARFYGIIIRMYAEDHPPPHFHAQYAEFNAIVDIAGLGVIAGRLPSRALGLVVEWASQHQEELSDAWLKASRSEAPEKIEPLK